MWWKDLIGGLEFVREHVPAWKGSVSTIAPSCVLSGQF